MRFILVKYILIISFCRNYSAQQSINDYEDNNETYIKSGMKVEEEDIIFRYINKDNTNGDIIFTKNVSQDTLKGWRKNVELKIITHGWLSSEKSMAVEGVKNAYLTNRDVNIITVDWSETASWKIYPLPAYFTSQVGLIVALLIDKLVEKNLVILKNVHIIGHSLGSHVAGASGASVKGGKVARITGLDPAGPVFEYASYATNNVLDPSDAEFVDVIHTAGGAAGYLEPLGHVDFYPNGGTPPQPGCFEDVSFTGFVKLFSCSHGRSYEYFRDSIKYPHTFKAYKCDTWAAFQNNNFDNSSITYMGDETPPTATGIYYLETRSSEPYGLG